MPDNPLVGLMQQFGSPTVANQTPGNPQYLGHVNIPTGPAAYAQWLYQYFGLQPNQASPDMYQMWLQQQGNQSNQMGQGAPAFPQPQGYFADIQRQGMFDAMNPNQGGRAFGERPGMIGRPRGFGGTGQLAGVYSPDQQMPMEYHTQEEWDKIDAERKRAEAERAQAIAAMRPGSTRGR